MIDHARRLDSSSKSTNSCSSTIRALIRCSTCEVPTATTTATAMTRSAVFSWMPNRRFMRSSVATVYFLRRTSGFVHCKNSGVAIFTVSGLDSTMRVALLLFLLPVAALAGEKRKLDIHLYMQGRHVYQTQCLPCHGHAGTRRWFPGPRD